MNNTFNTKQVIVIRKDLNMRKGKMIAQGSHASMAFLTKEMDWLLGDSGIYFETSFPQQSEAGAVINWLKNSFRKITVYVNSEVELLAVHQAALDSGLISHLVEDNGATEFHGIKTLTCCAIGPAYDNKFEGITDHLPLL